MISFSKRILFFMLFVSLWSAYSMKDAKASTSVADLIYYKGIILNINDNQPIAEAVAVKDGKILAVGAEADVLQTA